MSESMIKVQMPMLSMSMSEGRIAQWLVEDGAQVVEGQALYEVESEKSVFEVTAPASGVVQQLAPAGATLPVGAEVANIIREG